MNAAALWRDGLWNENPALVKLLGLCPLLAVSNSAINGLGLGIATLMTLLIANVMVSMLRNTLQASIRIPVYVLIIASTVSIIELLMLAWLPILHARLGIFLPLIVTNCLIIGRSEAFASRQRVSLAAIDALAMGLGFLLVLVILGAFREAIGQGTVLSGISLLFGAQAEFLEVQMFPADKGMLLALLPPGAFIALGLLLACKNIIDQEKL